MDADALDDAILELQAAKDRQRQDFDRLRREFDQLTNKLRYPGTRFLIDLAYKLVYANTALSVATLGPHTTLIEQRNDLQHGVYVMSAKQTATDAEGVIYDGAPVVVPGNAVLLSIYSAYNASGPSLDTYLVAYNTKGATVTVDVKVWRRLGLT